jgi:hypothetical protein
VIVHRVKQPQQDAEVLAAHRGRPGSGDPLAVLGEGLEDLVGGLGPRERLRVFVPLADPLADVCFELGDAAVGGAAELAVGQRGELRLY